MPKGEWREPGLCLRGPWYEQSVRLTSFPSSTERELGLVLFTKGIGVVQKRRALRHKSYVQKQLSDVFSYRENNFITLCVPCREITQGSTTLCKRTPQPSACCMWGVSSPSRQSSISSIPPVQAKAAHWLPFPLDAQHSVLSMSIGRAFRAP